MTASPHEEPPHQHAEDCLALFAEWRRYHLVAADETGDIEEMDRQGAARERDMFGRQLAALGCDPHALLAAMNEADGDGEESEE